GRARARGMVVGLLGTLRAGGAYVPLAPDSPPARLAFYLEDSRVPVLVTQKDLADRLPRHGARAVCLDGDWGAGAGQAADDPPPWGGGDDLVYVIYASGSTGQPQGGQVVHRALTNFLNSMRREPGLTEEDVLLAVTTVSFDIHALELWLPLTTGARVVLFSGVASDGTRLLGELGRSGATVMQATPA